MAKHHDIQPGYRCLKQPCHFDLFERYDPVILSAILVLVVTLILSQISYWVVILYLIEKRSSGQYPNSP